jgi:hypothetical protein
VQILEADDGFWSLPKPDKDGVLDNRIAVENHYKTNHKNANPVFLTNSRTVTKQNIHHMIADNVWKRVPMLRQAMQRCNLHMDLAENLLEMATEAVYLDSVNNLSAKTHPVSGASVKAQVGTNYAAVIHSGQHPQFDRFVENLVQSSADLRTGGSPNNTYWADDTKCSEIKEVIDEVQTILRRLLLAGQPSSELSKFADLVQSPGNPSTQYFKLRNTQ